ncbi:hypothetical protein QNM99_12825 [Pseudomonas sp. PCH446]
MKPSSACWSPPGPDGSLARLPLGLLTDRFGGRSVFFLLMLSCVLPLY